MWLFVVDNLTNNYWVWTTKLTPVLESNPCHPEARYRASEAESAQLRRTEADWNPIERRGSATRCTSFRCCRERANWRRRKPDSVHPSSASILPRTNRWVPASAGNNCRPDCHPATTISADCRPCWKCVHFHSIIVLLVESTHF